MMNKPINLGDALAFHSCQLVTLFHYENVEKNLKTFSVSGSLRLKESSAKLLSVIFKEVSAKERQV